METSKKEVKEHLFSMPRTLKLAKSIEAKVYYLNMNAYRNWHYQVSNNLKVLYKQIASLQLKGKKFKAPIELEFVLWKKTKGKADRANQLSIHEKFFCDALTELKCIPDDNDDYIVRTIYRTGGIDKENDRVDIIIREL